jgi:hypothetical protein
MQFARRLNRLYVAVALGVFAITFGSCGRAQTPQAVVEKYCSLDAQGANFSAANPNAKLIWALLINEDEAGYDQSVIVKSYQIGKSKISGTSADVEVTYASLGTLGGELHTKKMPHSETVVFHLTLVENAWKIDGLRIPPHISQSWMLSKLRRNLSADEQASKSDPRLKAAIKEIAQW